jgi:hypothetical protein
MTHDRAERPDVAKTPEKKTTRKVVLYLVGWAILELATNGLKVSVIA